MACTVLNERMPEDAVDLPEFAPGDRSAEWVNLAGQPVANLFHPEFEGIHRLKSLEQRSAYRDREITGTQDLGDQWQIQYDMSEFASSDNTLTVDKAIGEGPIVGQSVRIYVSDPALFQYSEVLGVGLNGKTLLFDR